MKNCTHNFSDTQQDYMLTSFKAVHDRNYIFEYTCEDTDVIWYM